MKSESLAIHPAFISEDSVAASPQSAAFSTRKLSGALPRRRYSRLAILAAREKCRLGLMPFENSQMDVPEGQMKIAQRFNAGMYATPGKVPKGRLKDGNERFTFSRPFGTRIQSTTIPALKRRIIGMSLRDKLKNLMHGLEPGKDWMWYKPRR